MTISTLRHRLAVGVLGLVVVSLCVAPIAGVTAGATAAESSLTVGDANVSVDGTTTVSIRLSDAPTGLAGYDLRVSMADGSVATITDIAVAEAYGMKNSSIAADGTSAYASGVDLNGEIGPGASDVLFVNVTVKGVSDGETALRVASANVDDDDGNDVNPTLHAGTITVGTGTSDSTDGSGNGSGTSGDGSDTGGDGSGTDSDGSTSGDSTGGSTGSTASTAAGSTTSGGTGGATNGTQTQMQFDGGSANLSVTVTAEHVNATVTDAADASTVVVDVPSTNRSAPSADAAVAVERLSIDVSGNDSQFEVTVGTLDDAAGTAEPITRSEDVNTEPVSYVTMETRNLSASALDGARVVFEVNASALPDGVAPENVTLYRYHDGSWQTLETTPLGNGTFAAETPGFSVFAVGVPQHSQVNETTTMRTTVTDATTTSGSTADTTTTSPDANETTPTTTPGLGPATAMIALAALGAALLSRH